MADLLPYQLADSFRRDRKGIVRSGDTRQIIVDNYVDLRPYLNTSFVTETPNSVTNRQPLGIYRFSDGTGLIKGRVQYIDTPPLTTGFQIVDLSTFRDFFANYSFSGEIDPLPRLINLVPPFLVDNNSWTSTVTFNGIANPIGIEALANVAGTSELNQNEFLYLEIGFLPFISPNEIN